MSTAALCGIPFFSGFFSKDEIIDSAKHYNYTSFFYVGIDRRLHDHRLHDAGHVPHVLRRAARCVPPTSWASHDTRRRARRPRTDDDVRRARQPRCARSHEVDHARGSRRPFPFARFDSPWQITAPLIVLAVLAFSAATSTRRRSASTGSSTRPSRRSGCRSPTHEQTALVRARPSEAGCRRRKRSRRRGRALPRRRRSTACRHHPSSRGRTPRRASSSWRSAS